MLLNVFGERADVFVVDTPAACFVKPAPGVSPPQLSGSGKHTKGGQWRWPLPAETPATSGPPRCLDRIKKNINVVPKIWRHSKHITDHPLTWQHGVLERLLRNDADQPVQQGGQHRAQIPEEAGLPHQTVLLPTLTQAAPWGLERTWKHSRFYERRTTNSTPNPLGSEVFSFQLSHKVDTKPVRMDVFCRRRRAARCYVKQWRGLFAEFWDTSLVWVQHKNLYSLLGVIRYQAEEGRPSQCFPIDSFISGSPLQTNEHSDKF